MTQNRYIIAILCLAGAAWLNSPTLQKWIPIPTPNVGPTPNVVPAPVVSSLTLLEIARSTGCPEADLMVPVVTKLQAAGYKVTRIDADKDATALTTYSPALLPTWIMRDATGAEIGRKEGVVSYDDLVAWFKGGKF